MTQYRLALGVATVMVCGCTTTGDDRRSGDTVTYALKADQRNAGKIAVATMGARGDKTSLRLEISGVPTWVARPVQLYTFIFKGPCARLGTTPIYALNEIVQANLFSTNPMGSGPFIMVKTVPTSLSSLRAGDLALVVRTSPADGNVDIFCGEMK